MKRWDEFWHAPVASVRPYLFVKGFLLLLAMDAWLLLSGRSAVYGFGGFNVAHFGWLDAVQPLPSPELYGAVQFLIGLLALFTFLLPLNRVVAAAIFALWTYGWSMSWLDNYQHHYLISSVLLCIAMFPISGRNDARPRVGAWAYKLLGVTIAVVYVWTSITKCDSTWLSGQTLQIVDRSNGFLSVLGDIASYLGVGPALSWPLISAGVIVVELIVAAGYLLAVSHNGRSRLAVRISLTIGLLAISLHAGFEAMGLKIGLFSYYMMMTACVFFLPEKPLLSVRRWVDRVLSPLEFLSQQSQKVLPDLWPCAPAVVMAVIVAAVLGLCGWAIEMPGAFAAGAIAGGALVAAAIWSAIRNSSHAAARYNIAAGVASLAMWIAVSVSSAPFDHYMLRGNQLLEMGRADDAVATFEMAGRFVGRSAEQQGDYHMNTAAALQAVGRLEDAETHLRAAAQWTPDSAQIEFNLGHVMLARGQLSQAVTYLHRAIEIDPQFAEAHLNLGNALLQQGHRDQAQAAFETAIGLKPDYAEAYYNLGNVHYSRAEFSAAIAQFQKALEFDPRLASAHNNLGNAFYRRGKYDDAETHYRKALRLDPKLANAHCNLGNICFRRGDYAAALEHYQDALLIEPDYSDARHNLRLARAKIERSGRFQ